MKGCVITAFHSQVVTGESDRTHRLHTNDQFKACNSAEGCVPASSSLRSHPRPRSVSSHPPSESCVSIRPHTHTVPVAGPALYWSLLSLFSWGLRGSGPLGHCVLSPANFHQSFAPPGAGTELGLAPAGGMECLVLDLARPTQGHHHQPGARDQQLASGGYAVLQCSLQHTRTDCRHHNTHSENSQLFIHCWHAFKIHLHSKPMITDLNLQFTSSILTMTSS